MAEQPWVAYTGMEAVQEDNSWKSAASILDPVYSVFINRCRKSQLLGKLDDVRLLLKALEGRQVTADPSLLRQVDCKQEVERTVTGVFTAEYRQLFECKSACQFSNPHGVTANILRTSCYQQCQSAFNKQVESRFQNYVRTFDMTLEGGSLKSALEVEDEEMVRRRGKGVEEKGKQDK